MAKANEIVVKGFTAAADYREDQPYTSPLGGYITTKIDVDKIPVEVTLTDADILAIGDQYLELVAKRNKANAAGGMIDG